MLINMLLNMLLNMLINMLLNMLINMLSNMLNLRHFCPNFMSLPDTPRQRHKVWADFVVSVSRVFVFLAAAFWKFLGASRKR